MDIKKLKPLSTYIVEDVPNINLLQSLGIRSGQKIIMKYMHPFGGPVVFKVDTRDIAIGRNVAKQIKLQEAN